MENAKTKVMQLPILGLYCTKVLVSPNKDEMYFFVQNKTEQFVFKLYHEQDCCEDVWIEDVCGNLPNLEDEKITEAECVSESEENEESDTHTTWTYYKFGTRAGSVTVRWCGTSNGYYSESVDNKLYKLQEFVDKPKKF
jgi:hypothetical protein